MNEDYDFNNKIWFTMDNYFWSKYIGVFVNLETGQLIKSKDDFGPIYTGTAKEWNEELTFLIYSLVYKTNIKNDVKGKKILTFSCATKAPEYSFVFDKKTKITVGKHCWNILSSSDLFLLNKENPEFSAHLGDSIDIILDPFYPPNQIVIGEYGKGYVCGIEIIENPKK